MLRVRAGFVRGGHVVLFGMGSRKRNLFTCKGVMVFSKVEDKHTSVIAGHCMPERLKSRAETGGGNH
jgi:hypothetical protein